MVKIAFLICTTENQYITKSTKKNEWGNKQMIFLISSSIQIHSHLILLTNKNSYRSSTVRKFSIIQSYILEIYKNYNSMTNLAIRVPTLLIEQFSQWDLWKFTRTYKECTYLKWQTENIRNYHLIWQIYLPIYSSNLEMVSWSCWTTVLSSICFHILADPTDICKDNISQTK